ncbi:MAG: sugar ABC transporter permease, partial [Spirochaetales bacterium]|nr:sugar ABC transporter permease [Spirochaetales bacterium]
FWISIRNTIYFVGASISVQVVLALTLAIIIFVGRFRMSVLIRTIIFFPGVLAPVSVSLAWRRMLEQDGVINRILGGIDFSWLSSVQLAIWCVIFVSIWQWVGYNLVIFYAGLQSLDIELLEAADVDGAGWGVKINRIIIPLMKPTIFLNVILNLIGSFRVFDIVYVLTRGGPVHNSEVLTTIMFYYSFAANGPNKMGVGSSVAVIMFAVVLVFGFFRIRALKRSEGAL